MSMGGSFLLLPILLVCLSSEELGLWYSFLAVSNLTLLFEFGFNPTFARNIVYVLSGANSLAKEGKADRSGEVNFQLLASVLKTAKLIYAAIALIALILVCTLGTIYVGTITSEFEGISHWIAWGVFCVAIFLNLYYLWTLTFLRGFGDIAGENKAKTFAKTLQVAVTAVLCFSGMGLTGAALSYLANGLFLRMYAKRILSGHCEIMDAVASQRVERGDIESVLSSVSHLAVKDGVVQLSLYLSTQGASIICSLFLGLEETAAYSLGLQLASAVAQLAKAYIASFYPAYQSAYANGSYKEMRSIVSRGVSAYWVLFLLGLVGVTTMVLPILRMLKPDTEVPAMLFILLALYCSLNEQHSIYCTLIAATNRIPYMLPYMLSASAGLLLSVALISGLNIGVWGLLLGQVVAQALYNDWRWPKYVSDELDYSFFRTLADGFSWWKGKLITALS